MKELIEALQIFLKYGNESHPTHCEHDQLMVCGYNVSDFSEEDIARLDKLGFNWEDYYDCFTSYKYGSC